MAHILDAVKIWIENSVGHSGYLAIFVLMLLESACIPIPSEVTMPVGGLLAAAGKLSFWWVGLIGAVANVAGSLVAYYVGAHGGRTFLLKYGRFLLIKPHDIERSEAWFTRYGTGAVFFSRLVPVARTFISLPAGIAKMPIRRFIALTFAGCVPWAFALTWAGYALGRSWKKILPFMDAATYAIAALTVLVIGVWGIRRLLKSRRVDESRPL
ncbi:MAG: DedA family protein [Actinomycetota bacterium]|nr:DedA family protein [Actinomycetota bacterium]